MNSRELRSGLQLVYNVLNERWSPERMDDHRWQFEHISGWYPLNCYAEVNPVMDAFMFRAICTPPVEPAHRELVARYIMRANYELPIGAWAMDIDDGEVRWKSGVYFGGCGLSKPLEHNVVESSVELIHTYVIGIAMLQAGRSMEDAIASKGQDHGMGLTAGMKKPG
jgi:hypothetical protein